MSQYPQYNVNNEHQLIRRQNTYVLDRKLVTIHSEDRDTSKWPNSNHFEVEFTKYVIKCSVNEIGRNSITCESICI